VRVAVTGGAGYIGSHTVVALVNAGHDVVIIDNFSNSSHDVIRRITELTGKPVIYHAIDIRQTQNMIDALIDSPPDVVIHFAGLKSVGESFEIPVSYYDNNVCGTVSLLKAMHEWGTRNIIFSSSATVYGCPETIPITETHPVNPTNPYGATKLVCENLIQASHAADQLDGAIILRYFNPVGAHPSGLIGELPRGAPNNLAPYVAQVAANWHQDVKIFGLDWPTHDGTGIRDYIHVMDLAHGHVASLDLEGLNIVNLGTGTGTSVLEMIRSFERACGHPIRHIFTDRRSGDVAICVADPTKAQKAMGWVAKMPVDLMTQDAWRWQQTLGKNHDD